MKQKETDDYGVGYGKPPKATRFKKGQSGNPKGRPKGARNVATILQKALDSQITVRDGATVRKMSGLEAMIHGMTVNAVKGNYRAVQMVLKLIAEYNVAEPEPAEAATPAGCGVLVVAPGLNPDMWLALYGPDDEKRKAVDRLIDYLDRNGKVRIADNEADEPGL